MLLLGVDKLRHSQEHTVGDCDILVIPQLPSLRFFGVRQGMERQGGDAGAAGITGDVVASNRQSGGRKDTQRSTGPPPPTLAVCSSAEPRLWSCDF